MWSKNKENPRKLDADLAFWRDLIEHPELVDRAVVFNRADYEELRQPNRVVAWLLRHGILSCVDPPRSKRVTESYAIFIPVGGKRRAGMECAVMEPMSSVVLAELSKRPADFPNLRRLPAAFGIGEDIWWGEAVPGFYDPEKSPEEHRELGRAFGYREDRILEMYPRQRG